MCPDGLSRKHIEKITLVILGHRIADVLGNAGSLGFSFSVVFCMCSGLSSMWLIPLPFAVGQNVSCFQEP